ncbi:hypothetical protein C8R45DRAFT_1090857 [Mycena sanguinolenta]|nr:hypothetical protein C8R45DRAFT_1090857 [Mycena sanguinolenta]
MFNILQSTSVRFAAPPSRFRCSSPSHLELFDFTLAAEESVDRVWGNISLIPRLTHLALNPDLQHVLPHAALCGHTQLQCILFLSSRRSLDGSPLCDDSRFVCIDEELDYYEDWLNGAVFGEDYWALADAFLAARRAGTDPDIIL